MISPAPAALVRRGSLPAAAVFAGALLSACATSLTMPALESQPGPAGIHALIRDLHVGDARYQAVRDRPFLQVDPDLRYRLDDYTRDADARAKRDFIRGFLRQSAAAGDRAVSLALARIPPEDIQAFNTAQGIAASAGDARTALRKAYLADSARRLTAELRRVETLDSGVQLDAYWEQLAGNIEASILTRGRTARRLSTAPAVPFVTAWIAYHNAHDYRGPLDPDFARQIVLSPGAAAARPADVPPPDWRLLQRFAPVIVQQIAPAAPYPDDYDHFGTVSLSGPAPERALPRVDPSRPAVYGFVDRKPIQGHAARQLVYTIWYPQHPAMKSFDPEAGPLDGWTVRVTLDAQDRPALVESVSNCGCYYKIFPSTALEARSAAAFPETLPGKQFHIERARADRFDAVVPETVPGLDASPHGLVLYFSSGYHQLITVRPRAALAAGGFPASDYTLHAYEDLERQPFHGYEASIFGEDGLVRDADRPECRLLTPSGLYHAGHPRQRGTQMIYFDESEFDDPRLLEDYLRLPPDAFAHDV